MGLGYPFSTSKLFNEILLPGPFKMASITEVGVVLDFVYRELAREGVSWLLLLSTIFEGNRLL